MSDSKCADESDGMDIQKGQYLTSSLGKYSVKELLGRGGYGAVYKVQLEGCDKLYALKAERKMARRDHTKLNMEVFILKAMASHPKDRSHFARIYDKAKKIRFYFIVMTLLGESLAELKKKFDPPVFSSNTGYAMGMQSLEAIEELHKLFFIHRDLKPGNFAMGLAPYHHILYILDFGIARRIVNEKSEIRVPREKVPFKGTIRFASLATHQNKELSFKDDIESWIYMIADMMNPKGVQWKMENTKEAVGEMKAALRTAEGAKERLFYGMAIQEFVEGFNYLNRLHYTDKPEYKFFYDMLRAAAAKDRVKMEPPFDWELKTSSSVME